jgi:ATP-binding cassette subfamily F protein 3
VVLTGPNCGGKSTLLKIICGTMRADEGSVRQGASVVTGYYSQEQEDLDPLWAPLQAIREIRPMTETEARSLLHLYLFSATRSSRPSSARAEANPSSPRPTKASRPAKSRPPAVTGVRSP